MAISKQQYKDLQKKVLEVQRLLDEPVCWNCTRFREEDQMCMRWNAQVPDKNQVEGCTEWEGVISF